MAGRRTTAVAAILGSLAATAAADPPSQVGRYGDLANVVVEGTSAVAAEQVRDVLVSRVSLVPATRPHAPLPALVEKLATLAEAGYRASGFPQARVTGSFDEGRDAIVLHVVEGPICRRRDVIVLGVEGRLAEVVRDALVKPSPRESDVPRLVADSGGRRKIGWFDDQGKPATPTKPVWKTGDPWEDLTSRKDDWIGRIRRALQNEGHWNATIDLDQTMSSEQTQVDLHVSVTNAGVPVVLEQIKVLGAGKNTAEEILACAGLEVGMLWNLKTQLDAESRLYDSGRFVWHRFKVNPFSVRGGRCWLRLHLEESPRAPPLREELTEKDRLFLTMLAKLSQIAEEDVELLLRVRLTEDDVTNPASSETGADTTRDKQPPAARRMAEMLCGASRARGQVASLAWLDGRATYGYRLHASGERIRIGSLHSGRRWELAGRKLVVPTMTIAGSGITPEDNAANPGHDPSLKFSLKYGFGFTHRHGDEEVPLPLSVSFSPAFALDSARRESTVERRGDRLLITSESVRAEIDASTGRPARIWVEDPEDGSLGELCVGPPGTIAELDAAFESLSRGENLARTDRPIESLCDFLFRDVQSLPGWNDDSRNALGVLRKLTTTTVRNVLHEGETEAKTRGEPAIDYWIPAGIDSDKPGAVGMLHVAGDWGLWLDSILFRRDSTYSRMAREFAATLILQDDDAPREIDRLTDSSGPLLCLYAAETIGRVLPVLRPDFARRGLKRLTAGEFRDDLKELLDRESLVGRVLTMLVETTSQLDEAELDLLLRWSVNASDEARRECRAKLLDRSKSPEDVFLDVASALWTAGLRDRVANRLRGHLAPPEEKPKPGGAPPADVETDETRVFGIRLLAPAKGRASKPAPAIDAARASPR